MRIVAPPLSFEMGERKEGFLNSLIAMRYELLGRY